LDSTPKRAGVEFAGSSAFVATHFGAAAAALSWSAAEWIKNGRASALVRFPARWQDLWQLHRSRVCGPMPALVIGLVAGAVCYWMVTKVKAIFGYDDALDAFGVHGAAGRSERCSRAYSLNR